MNTDLRLSLPGPRSHVLGNNGQPDSPERSELRARLLDAERKLADCEQRRYRFLWLRAHRPDLFAETAWIVAQEGRP